MGVFRTSPIGPMEIEANIPPPAIRIRQKIQKYALRVTSFENTSPIRIRTPITYPPEFSNGLDNFNIFDTHKFVDWFQRENSEKRYPTQLIRNLASLNRVLDTDATTTIQPYIKAYPPWQPPQANLEIRLAKTDKETAAKAHNKLIREIFHKFNNHVFYTDGLEIGGKIGAAVVYRGANRKWNLGTKVDNYDAEL